MISSAYKFIFVHVPKTGGNSVQDALRNYADDKLVALNSVQDGIERFSIQNEKFKSLHKHSALRDYQNALGQDIEQPASKKAGQYSGFREAHLCVFTLYGFHPRAIGCAFS